MDMTEPRFALWNSSIQSPSEVSSDGTERSSVDILAREVKVIDDRLTMESGL